MARASRRGCRGQLPLDLLTPISFALSKSLDTDGETDWLPVFRKACDVSPDTSLPLRRIGTSGIQGAHVHTRAHGWREMTASCSVPDCPFSTTGECLEGVEPPSSCPRLASKDTVVAGDNVNLPSGEAISEDDAFTITRKHRTNVVVVAGPKESGKTTIVTSIYESLLDAPFGDASFAGSQTLLGFKKLRCHEGRMTSNRTVAHTVRT